MRIKIRWIEYILRILVITLVVGVGCMLIFDVGLYFVLGSCCGAMITQIFECVDEFSWNVEAPDDI